MESLLNVVAMVVPLGFAVWMLYDAAKSSMPSLKKAFWVMGLVLFGPLAAIPYAFLISRKPNHRYAAIATFVCLLGTLYLMQRALASINF